MKFIKLFENFNNNSTLIIVDVQRSFHKFFTEIYLDNLKKYCKNFQNVYQIWDNHSEGKHPDKDYLYDDDPDTAKNKDLYHFPNQKELIEKRYNYNVDADFYKKILSKEIYNQVKEKEDTRTIKKGNIFATKEDTIITYIGNNHKFFHCPKKLYDLLVSLKGGEITIVGGADSECLEDVAITAESLGVKVKRDYKYIYTASGNINQ